MNSFHNKRLARIFAVACLALFFPFSTTTADKSAVSSIKFNFVDPSPRSSIVPPSDIDVETYFFETGKKEKDGQKYRALGAFRNIYDNIDVVCYGDEHEVEYVFMVYPGGDPSRIILNFGQPSELNIGNTGKVTYKFDKLEVTQGRPVVFQRKKDLRDRVEGSYNTIAYSYNVGISPGESFDRQVSNYEFVQFLNDTEAHPESPRGANMFFDDKGGVWMNESKKGEDNCLFDIGKSLVSYDSKKLPGERYSYKKSPGETDYFKDRPVAGATWYGAAKFSNWLTIVGGRGHGKRVYSEGPKPEDWPEPTEEGWNRHFFDVSAPDPRRGFKVETAYNPESIIEIHFLVSFFTAERQGIPEKTKWKDRTPRDDYVKPEGFTDTKDFQPPEEAEKTGIPAQTVRKEKEKPEDEEPTGAGILYKEKPADEKDEEPGDEGGTQDTGDGDGGGGSSAVSPAVPPGPPTHIVTISSQNSSAAVPVTVSRADRNGLSDGLTTFTREYIHNTPVTFTAPAAEPGGNPFRAWMSGGAELTDSRTINIHVNNDLSLTAVYDQLRALTVLSTGTDPVAGVNVTVTPADRDGKTDITTSLDFSRTYIDGENVTLEADLIAPNGNRFYEWQSSLGPTYSSRQITVPMDSDITLTAVYLPVRTLTLASQNPAANVGIDVGPDDINGDNDAVTGVDFTRSYFDGESLTLTADLVAPGPGGNRFYEWQSSLGPTYSSRTINLNIIGNTTLTAVYMPPRTITLASINPNNGVNITATADLYGNNDLLTIPAGVDRTYEHDTSVTFEAELFGPGGVSFEKWQRDGADFSTDRQITLPADADFTLTAVYVLPWTLTIASANPDNGVAISVGPNDINGDGAVVTAAGGTPRIYYHNTDVTLVAEFEESGGNRFRYWQNSLGGFIYSRWANVTVTTNFTMTAQYDLLRVLTVNSQDPGGGVDVAVSPNDVYGDGGDHTAFERVFDDNEDVTLTADNVSMGQTFLKWLRNGIDYDNNRTTIVTMNADYTMTAVYSYVPGPIDDPDPSPSGL